MAMMAMPMGSGSVQLTQTLLKDGTTNYAGGVGQVTASGGIIKFFTISGSATVRSTGQAGVGLFFERETHDGAKYPVVQDVTEKGSADREGSIKTGEILLRIDGRSCRDMTLTDLKSAVVGSIGTVVELLLLRKNNNTQRVVRLSRAPLEYWALYDANAEWQTKHNALREKNKQNEALSFKYKLLAEDLQKRVKELDETVKRTQEELLQQKDINRTLGMQTQTLSMEKKSLENTMDAQLKKTSEITLHFKSAELLAVEMTEKARQCDNARANEERIRKLAEDREVRLQRELTNLNEAQRLLEKRANEQAQRIAELEDRLQQAKAAEHDNKRLYGEHLILRTNTDAAIADRDSAKSGAEQYKREMLKEQKEASEALAEIEKFKKKLVDAEDKVKTAKITADKAIADKEATLAREQDLVAENKKTIGQKADCEATIHKLEAELRSLKMQVDAAEKKEVAANVAKATALKDKDEARTQAKEVTTQNTALKTKLDAVVLEASILTKGLEDALAHSKAEIELLQCNLKDSMASALTSREGLEKQLYSAKESLDKERSLTTAAESKLSAAVAEQGRLKSMLKEFEDSLSKFQKDASVAQDDCKTLVDKNEALEAQINKLQSDAAARTKDYESLKATAGNEASAAKTFKAELDKIQKDLVELKKQLDKSTSTNKDLEVQSKTWQEKCSELEKKLSARENSFKENATLSTKVQALEHELAGVKEDRKRLEEGGSHSLTIIDETVKKYEELMKNYNDDIFNLKATHNQEMRALRDQYDLIDETREALFGELNRFLSMPNPCGVGMACSESKSKAGRSIVVQGIQPGLSADLSGVIRINDELIQVNEYLSADLSLTEVQAAIAGNRGTQVALRMRRKIEAGEQKGETFDYRIVLKRGAWGPEHCVMTPEDLDMINTGRWPRQGGVSAEDFSMDAVTGGIDCSLKYEGKGMDSLGLETRSGIPASASGKTPSEQGGPVTGIKTASLTVLNKMGSKSNVLPPQKK